MKKFLLILLTVFLFLFPFTSTLYPAYAQAATLSLNPSSGTFNQGCSFSLNVDLDTGGAQTDGTDAIIFYDTTRFNALTVTKGPIYPDYPGNNIDSAEGKITISGLASVTTPFTGKGTLATINFTVQPTAPAGATQMTFDFDPSNKGKTTDSNVVQRGTVVDILNSVVDGNYVIGTGSCVAATPAPKGGPATPSATEAPVIIKKELPPAGSEQLTYTIAIVGSILTILGILGLALL